MSNKEWPYDEDPNSKLRSFTCKREHVEDQRRYKCDICLTCKWFRLSGWINDEWRLRNWNCFVSFYVNKERSSTTGFICEPEKYSCGFWRERDKNIK